MIPAAIALAVVLIALYFLLLRRRQSQALSFSNLAFFIAAAQSPAWPMRLLAAVWILACLLISLSVAGPRVRAAVPVRDGTVVLCIDTSGSMATGDVQPTRAQAARAAMQEFVDESPPGIAIGVVSFAGDAQAIAPPSRDRDRIAAALQAIPPPNGATAIGDALALAAREMPRSGRRVIVLITDGENNAGSDPLAAAKQIGALGIRIYTVGIGTNSGALVPGTLQAAGIDEDALRSYAAAGGGAYSRAANATQLRRALSDLGRTTTFEKRTLDISHATALAGALLAILAFLSGAWTRSI
jgi:Ca-activated chloride channel family protein